MSDEFIKKLYIATIFFIILLVIGYYITAYSDREDLKPIVDKIMPIFEKI